ncbi:MAG: Zn-dependent oligopeptidase [Planctomycetota bacterium]|nr:Zn-dependent oligopeptidase [Planctomycetota bacterium]
MDEVFSLSSAEELKAFAEGELDRARGTLDEIAGQEGASTPDTALRPLNRLFIQLGDARRGIGLLRSVHPSPEMRRAAERCEQQIARFFTDLGLNRRLYEVVKACDPSSLDAIGRRMHEHLLRDFHRSGVDRNELTRAEVQRLRSELVELGQEFARNILSDVRSIRLDDVSELDGLPPDYVAAHSPDDEGKISITTDYPDYNPFMSYARSGRRREELYREFRRRAYPQNLPVLDKILERRYELATLLGYSNWADYAVEDKMINNSRAIGEFIERVSQAAEKRSREEYERLLERKRRDELTAAEVADWEKGYYEELLRLEEFRIDSRKLRPYFDYRRVKEGIFAIAHQLFGVEFRSQPDARTWSEDVEVVDVFEEGRAVGRVYLDMHPRQGKFKHAAMFPLVQGIQGGRAPVAALVCNFPRPEGKDGTALLEHDDVVTFFHEFGHLLHHLFGRDLEWVEFSGTGTEWDFVEVPSQLMEEWAWDGTSLRSFARHHETDEPIPVELVERLRSARDFGRGLQVRQQMFYACLSLECHLEDPRDIELDRLQRDLQNRFSRFRFVDDTYFHASFGHLDSYSALYYTYMWSLVIEKDIFSRFEEHGVMCPEIAARYRRCILAVGGSKDAAELVRDFLGRDYSFRAYERWLDGAV